MTNLNFNNIKKEIVMFLRNNDIFTILQRNVTTTTHEPILSSALTVLINVSNIKNIRSITVGAVTLSYGFDYDYDIMYNDSGVIKTKITFTSAQTGNCVITYDYGTDKIFTDFPRPDLTLSSFPRIASDLISIASSPGGLGQVIQNEITFTVVVYDFKQEDIDDYISDLREKFIDNMITFYHIKGVIYPLSTGPLLKSPTGKDKILQKNQDFKCILNYEK